ncbi:DUF378 domain-containing protein [Mesorhizobium sangaii]|uniref:DUF378 domain-containing protein n=1 Tax=Mesorhizobium sangaii TaxID=505389 RepID=A0A841PAP5_9HYPH|nr:DUF378 domain-containing protein [Mesorhizobium sangaii]MBB6412267.1 hypothetical protein [Mesorhizobium sangaii]
MRNMNLVTLALIILGGLNFLSMGATGYDVLGTVLGGALLARLAYLIIGLAAIWQLMPGFQSLTLGEVDAERHLHHHP